ncbi:MAG: DUF4174 domain-containing protein [Cyanobacteria bacterium P01_A01_bin.135]
MWGTRAAALSLSVLCSVGLGNCAMADIGQQFERYRWQKRVLLIFAPAASSEALAAQNAHLSGEASGLDDRDLVVWRLIHGESASVDGDLRADVSPQEFYQRFGVSSEAFAVVLVGKDGTVKQQQNEPLPVSELFSTIDAMPMRQREMQQGGG